MRRVLLGTMATAALALTFNFAAPASAQVARPMTGMTLNQSHVSQDLVTEAQWRRGRNWRGRRHWRHRRHGRHWGPAVGFGLGALFGGALAAQARANNDAVAYCMQRFRSYDPASGTYLGYDGRRHPCP